MSVQVFCNIPVTVGYQGDPASTFVVTVTYNLYNSDEVGNILTGSTTVNIPIGDSPSDVFTQVYTDIVAQCTAVGWPTPATSDVYAYVPTSFSVMMSAPQ
jgi:hypothetical protein